MPDYPLPVALHYGMRRQLLQWVARLFPPGNRHTLLPDPRTGTGFAVLAPRGGHPSLLEMAVSDQQFGSKEDALPFLDAYTNNYHGLC
jgi:hypothetical protein